VYEACLTGNALLQYKSHSIRCCILVIMKLSKEESDYHVLIGTAKIPLLLHVKGIVSRKFDILFWCRWRDKYLLHLFYFNWFLKYHRFHVEFSNIKRSAVAFY
jgi:hypothetical protein